MAAAAATRPAVPATLFNNLPLFRLVYARRIVYTIESEYTMQKTTNTTNTSATNYGPNGSDTGGQWARERARMAAGSNKAAARFVSLYSVLQIAAIEGEKSLSFTEANRRAGLKRGEKGDAANSWRLALTRTAQICGDHGWRVDSDAQTLTLTA